MIVPFRMSEHRRQWWSRAALGAIALALAATVWGTVVRVQQSIVSGREAIVRSGQLLASALDHELDIHVYNVMAMDHLAQQYLSGRARATENPLARLAAVPGRDGYASLLSDAATHPDSQGRITGQGPLPAVNDPLVDEMAMAVGLTPLMRAIRARSHDVPWVQYASKRGFMFLFPQQGSEDFHFRRELLQRDYFARATPQANPRRAVFWSRPYADAAGRGTILTVTKPVYRGDEFLGSVSIDVTLASLQRLLGSRPLPATQVLLLGEDSRPLAASTDASTATGTHHHEVVPLRLRSAPWTLELQINRDEVVADALRGRGWHITTVAVLAISLVFIGLLMRSARRVRELAIRDGLTGLYNRRHFDEVAARQVEMARRGTLFLGLAIVDIDHFKKFNDHYGHPHGDAALRAVAQALQGALRRGSDQLFRIGGEEFAALVALHDPSELAATLDMLNESVRRLQWPHALHPAGHVTVSVGGTVVDRRSTEGLASAYKTADAALYAAKVQGRDRHVVSLTA